jgi:hypothetical protein
MNLLSSTFCSAGKMHIMKMVPINRAQFVRGMTSVWCERRPKLNGYITHAKWIVDIVEIIRCVQNQMHRTKKL